MKEIKTWADAILYIRNVLYLDRKSLAKELEVSPPSIAYWESGKKYVRMIQRRKIVSFAKKHKIEIDFVNLED